MKTVDVRIGETYLCRVGERLVQVTVIARHPGEMHTSGRRGPDVFCIQRVGAFRPLPKNRTAAALRPIPEASTPEATRPSDYETCGDCGFDHSYEQNEAVKTHTALIGAVQVSTLEELAKLDDDTLDALCEDNPTLTHEPYEDKAAKHLDTQPCIRCNTALENICAECGNHLACKVCGAIACSCPHEPIIGAVQVSTPEEVEELDCPALPHEPATERDLDGLPSYDTHAATAAGEKAYTEAIASGCTPDEADRKAVETYDKVSIATDSHATPVSQEFYLSAAENKIGWCVNCQAFQGEDLEPDSRECECPECHHHTLYGAELAFSGGLIIPVDDDAPAKPFWRCESCGHENHERAMPPDRQAFYAGNRPKWLTVCPRCKSDDFTPVGY